MVNTKVLTKEEILALAKEVFERNLNSNPNDFRFDPDHSSSRILGIETSHLDGTISHHEKWDNDYILRTRVLGMGYTVVISDYYNGEIIFFFDDGDYGHVEDYTEDDVVKCFDIIYNELKELLN